MTIRKRLAALKGVYGPEMPFRAPHTAGPALWALRQLGGDFEVSVAAIEGTTPWLKGLVAVEVALYRQARGCSPTVNFGRMPSGFRMSTGSDARLVAAGKRYRGGRAEAPDEIVHPGNAPLGALDGDPLSRSWCGHRWSEWGPVSATSKSIGATEGLYRLRDREKPGLLYIGQGLVRTRLRDHVAKGAKPDHRQGFHFASPSLECSVALCSEWLPFQRLEFENDLIAAYILTTGEVPGAQFLG
jgi:hypothetical protein